MKNFDELGINATLRKAIDELGFVQPMPVQEQVIPRLLDGEKDIIALAQTGTGKTAAFGLPLLQRIDTTTRQTQAVVMSPTRELCLQICDDLQDFGKYMEGLHVTAVYGGAPLDSQIRQLRKGSQIIVATPGRLVDLIERGVADITTATTIVLDEADEMLNMGFSDSINAIFEQLQGYPRTLQNGDDVVTTSYQEASEQPMHITPSPEGEGRGEGPRTLMFSATMSREVEKVARQYLHDYEEIVVGSRNEGAENVDHTYYMVHAKDKYLALKRVVDYYPKIYAIIFCRTKIETQEVADKLIRDGYNAESLHGDLSQPQRDQTMQKFRQHTIQLLVATDVAARGLDVNDLTHVINYGMPDDTESYTHRSGRTGRAGKKGSSIAIIHSREQFKIRAVEKIIQKKFTRGTLPTPTEICKKQLFRVMDHITKVDVDDETINPFMEEIQRHFEYFDKEDIIKKIVMMEFSRFLEYYADEPDIEEPVVNSPKARDEKSKRRKDSDGRDRGPEHRASEGYSRLFINLGKAEGFYPGEVMQFINQHVSGRGKKGEARRQEVGHIDLMSHYCFIEVPEEDAQNVMAALDGTNYHGRQVRCNAEGSGKPEGTFDAPVQRERRRGGKPQGTFDAPGPRDRRRSKHADAYADGDRGHRDTELSAPSENKKRRRDTELTTPSENKKRRRDDGRPMLKPQRKKNSQRGEYTADDWRALMAANTDFELKGEEPDFSEEGWARRKPKKKK